MSVPPSAPSLAAAVASLSSLAIALPSRLLASADAAHAWTRSVKSELASLAQRSVSTARAAATAVEKETAVLSEALRVCEEQLEAYAVVLEWGNEDEGVAAAAAALLDGMGTIASVHWERYVALAACGAPGDLLRLRDGIAGPACVFGGPGIAGLLCGGGEEAALGNVVSVRVVDAEGEAIGSVCEGDVSVSVDGDGAGVLNVAVVTGGLVEVALRVDIDCVGPIRLSVRVCGVELGGGPLRLEVCMLYAVCVVCVCVGCPVICVCSRVCL